jgi:hypothetical protein
MSSDATPTEQPTPGAGGAGDVGNRVDLEVIRERWRQHAEADGCAVPPAVLLRHIPELIAKVDRLIAERDALAKFKAYVHRRLDEAGIPTDPDSPHKAEGCRIGGRLDVVFAERDALRAVVEEMRLIVDAAKAWGDSDMSDPEGVCTAELKLADALYRAALARGPAAETGGSNG